MSENKGYKGCVTEKDEYYMKLAIELAKKGAGFANPNPMVGAVIVKDDKIIGTGYHESYGQLHGERNAIKNAVESVAGATLYVNLEPCCHYGKTPPCTEAIIENKIGRVVAGMTDPNSKVSSKGIAALRQAGIEVKTGVLEKECRKLNAVFVKYITEGMPYVAVKYAMTMDGKIATRTGASKWISGEKAREKTHFLRHKYSAIMVGIGTVLSDNPELTCRLTKYDGTEKFKNPVRIVCDSNLRIPLESNLVRTAKEIPVIVATGKGSKAQENKEKIKSLKEYGCKILEIQALDGKLDMRELMRKLAAMQIDSVLVEGGGTLHENIISQGLADYIYTFISPLVIGGENAKTPVEGEGAESLDSAARFKLVHLDTVGEDVLAEYEKLG